MAAAQAPLEPGIYTVDKEAVGSLAPKFRGMSYAFMVTNAIGEGSDIQMWCADLVMAGKVPSGREYAGLDVWALHGHPFNNVFVVVDDALVECDSEWNRRYVWKRSHDLHGKLFREAATPPILAKSFPSDNFIEAVINKNPSLNEPYSPSTQTIVEACAYFSQPLSVDARERQEQLVRLYTAETPLYHEMNQALRDDSIDKMRYFGAYIKELRDVFKTDHEDQIITPFEGTVWRGIKFPDASQAMKQYKPGSVFVWPAFTSMSTAKNAAMGFGNLVFEITCFPPPGHYDDDTPEYAPASVEEWSCYKSEHEILFPPNVKFKVKEIKEPDGENGLVSPLVVCETVGFDTDGGIIEFSKLQQEEAARRRARGGLEEQVAAQQGQLDEVHSKLDDCCDRVNDCCQRVDDCFQRLEEMTQHLDRCFGRLERCENSAALGVQGLQELRSRLSGGPGAPQEELKSLQQQLKSCAAESDLVKLRERLESEAAARVKADEVHLREEQRLGARCDDLQAKVLELASAQSQERGAVQQKFEYVQVEQKQGRSSMEQELAKLSQKMQAMLAESIAREKGIEREVTKLSQKMQDQLTTDVRRSQEMDQVLKGLTDKCYMTNMILATEKLKHETLEIKSLLSTEHKRSHSSASKRAPLPQGNARATLDAAVQGVSDIKMALESLRFQLPKDMQAGASTASFMPSTDPAAEQAPASRGLDTPAATPRQGPDHMAVGGALQAARAARRPSAGGPPADDG